MQISYKKKQTKTFDVFFQCQLFFLFYFNLLFFFLPMIKHIHIKVCNSFVHKYVQDVETAQREYLTLAPQLYEYKKKSGTSDDG